MELDDLHGSEEELRDKGAETISVATNASDYPIADRLVPSAGKGLGNRVKVNVGDVEAQNNQRLDSIVMTKTVQQSHQPF